MIKYKILIDNKKRIIEEHEVEADTTSITNNGDLLFLEDNPGKSGKFKLIRAYAVGVWISVEEVKEEDDKI